MITVKKEDKQLIIKLLQENNINYIDKAGVANEMLVDIKNNFNFFTY